MCTYIWPDYSAQSKAKQESSVLIFIPTYMRDTSPYEHAFPNAKLFHTALLKHISNIDAVPNLRANYKNLVPPYLSAHLCLMQAYWSTVPRWPSWCWLENELSLLRECGYHFEDGCITNYKQEILRAASCVKDFVLTLLHDHDISAVCVYGRGHWTMNAVAVAAEEQECTLYVLEKGILPKTYLLDIDLPYSGPNSTFRRDWELFRHATSSSCTSQCNPQPASCWDIYLQGENKQSQIIYSDENCGEDLYLLVGQCLFDYNLQSAPYRSPLGFIEYCLSQNPQLQCSKHVLYRPHPLSPEMYGQGKIRTSCGYLNVTRGNPVNILSVRPNVITWNSVLGLEACLFYNCPVVALDPDCFYKTLSMASSELKNCYIAFLRQRSTKVD
ncbi:MAG: hypothetical protein ACYSUY_11295 [Planctomycetota bacterium]